MTALLAAATEATPEATVALTGEASVIVSGTFDQARLEFSVDGDGQAKSRLPKLATGATQFVVKGKTGQNLYAKVLGGGPATSINVSVL